MVFEWDDFGANHVISDQCQSHDCRDQLYQLKTINDNFKCTLFAIPAEMTLELYNWAISNENWVELAVHGFNHTSNYEASDWTWNDMERLSEYIEEYSPPFKKIFRAPGWQISDEALQWLAENDWVVCDQSYNDHRRPDMLAYVRHDGDVFKVGSKEMPAYHGHTWDVGWNGIYEDFEKVAGIVKNTTDFKFISECFDKEVV